MKNRLRSAKTWFSIAVIAATSVASLGGGLADSINMSADVKANVNGDNVTLQSSSYATNRFMVGKILMGGVDAVNDTNVDLNNNTNAGSQTSVTIGGTTYTPDNLNDIDLGQILGTDPKDMPKLTTNWQDDTGAQWVTGLDDVEFSPAYTWAREYGITTVPFSSSRLDAPILRYEFAKMMLAYIQNVEHKNLEKNTQCDVRNYADYNSMDASVRVVVQQACDTGLMGWKSVVGVNQTVTTPLARFRPYDVMTEAEINFVANRYFPSTIRLAPTNNTRSAVIRFLYSVAPTIDEQ